MIEKLLNKKDNECYKVYDITYDKAGYPQFLIYKDGEWVRMSAKHFRPYTYEDELFAKIKHLHSLDSLEVLKDVEEKVEFIG